MKKTLFTFCIVLALFIMLIQIPTTWGAIGFGVGPVNIEFPDAHRGETYPGKKITFINEDDYDERTITINLSGDIADWDITFYHSDDLTTPITSFLSLRDTEDDLFFVLTIPDDIAVGTYQGWIFFIIPNQPDESGGMILPINLTISINVIADFSYNPKNATTDDTIHFTDNSNYLDGAINLWFWDFGDGYNSILQNPQYQYSTSGDYNVTLRVTSSNGYSDEISKTISILKPEVEDIPGEQNETNGNETSNNVEDKDDGTPGFELILVFFTIILILFIKRKKN